MSYKKKKLKNNLGMHCQLVFSADRSLASNISIEIHSPDLQSLDNNLMQKVYSIVTPWSEVRDVWESSYPYRYKLLQDKE